MANTTGVEQTVNRWRNLIKDKKRHIASFEDIIQNKIEALRPWIFTDEEPLDNWKHRHFKYNRKRQRHFIDHDWKSIKVGQSWGGPDMSAMFKSQAKIPARFKNKKVVLNIYLGGDSLLYIDGKPFHGLDPFRNTVVLTNCATGKENYSFEIESYIMWHFGEGEVKNFECSNFAVMNQEIHDTYWDLKAAFNVMITEGIEADLVEFLSSSLHKATLNIDQNVHSYEQAKKMAFEAKNIINEVYKTKKFKKNGLIHLCGTSHLDIVFLWTHAEFLRKLGRTHATAIRLMEQYPSFKFSQSQPLMYSEMKEFYPTLFEEVKQRVKEGRWEIIGAFWVECDCNLISGESFVRQLIYGIDFLESEFGVTPKTAWVPDVFGNAWTMPQILVKSGIKYFVTHKMSVWNDTNPWKENVFWWEGPDGSRIFSVIPPTHMIGTLEANHLKENWDKYSAKTSIGESLYTYGWGDGGGGPDTEMLEYAKRYKNFPGLVSCKTSTVENALKKMLQKAKKADIPTINDELYLEEHRGVYTTKGKLKKLNRYCENLYRDAELFSSFSRSTYPYQELNKGWKILLTNQFHDSLPGTHINPAYNDLLDSYETAVKIGEKVLKKSFTKITQQINTKGLGKALVLFNSREFKRDSLVKLEHANDKIHILNSQGEEIPHQFIKDMQNEKGMLIFWAKDIPSVGYKTYRIVEGKGKLNTPSVKVTKTSLENKYIRVKLNNKGEILSFFDKQTNRECIDPKKRGNVMQLYEDIPGNYDAWDIVPNYTDTEFEISTVSIDIAEQGPVRSAIRVEHSFNNGSSSLIQNIILGAEAKRLDFETYVNWKEKQKLLKTRFYTNIKTRKATYDIAYGNIERSCYQNNSYEKAKFEVSAHMWMDLSQADFGMSLLNDCKYGHEAHGKMMALTLLKCPKYPDPLSDQEEHFFTYSLFPHANSWREGETIPQALDLNCSLYAFPCGEHKGSLASEHSFLTLANRHVTLEALKKAEKSDELIIRLVEKYGSQCDVTVHLDCPITTAHECNLLERENQPAKYKKNKLMFKAKPYEIRTFKIERNQ